MGTSCSMCVKGKKRSLEYNCMDVRNSLEEEEEDRSVNQIPFLEEKIVFNILTWLPAEELHNLTCVCRLWLRIIKSSSFIQAHLRRSKPGLITIEANCTTSPSVLLRTNILKKQDDIIMVREFTAPSRITWSSCNGLILLGRFVDTVGKLLLANPATKRLMQLPSPTHGTNSMFDHIFGMTYLPSIKTHKVIHWFTCSANNKMLGWEILTIGDRTWGRLKTCHTKLQIISESRKIVFVKDVAHWVATEDDSKFVVSLDMIEDEDQIHKTELPCCFSGVDELLDIGGVLSFVSRVDNRSTHFDIWGLKDICEGNWVKQRTIRLEGVSKNLLVVGAAALENGKVIIFRAGEPSTYCYYTYDVQLKQTRYLDFDSGKIALVLPHVDSLVSCRRLYF
ncbi:hypothetical protein FRX31_033910 [Thalictrum thalictroides]|uniref:F-box domain-containing protein n=1 Tax=Thalictrum thalictroides TaxID=46969 RepID=A0A7J6UV76_THATH|nr:hypothetical protein FRX31_033910 [Thalictrum thalictroides]